jgi:putative transposase
MVSADAGMESPRGTPRSTDVSDAEWQRVAPLLSQLPWSGRKRKYEARTVINAILYVQRTGKSWRQLPADLPPWQSVYRYLRRWLEDGTWQRVEDVLEHPSQAILATSSTRRYVLIENDGQTWIALDEALTLFLSPTATGSAWLHGYANLLTTNNNLGKQLGMRLSGGAYGEGAIVAWQESGGTVLAPISVQATVLLTESVTYTLELVWKSARAMIKGEEIIAGAGTQTPYSPCGLVAMLSPPSSTR